MKRLLFVLIFIISCLKVNAQLRDLINDSGLMPRDFIAEGQFAALVGYNYNGKDFWEAGVVKGIRGDGNEFIGADAFYGYLSLSSEFNFSDKLTICPKFGYHLALALVHFGISAFDYTDFNSHKPGLRPEIGLTLAGLLSVTYGYSISPNVDAFNFSNHTLGIKMIFGSRLFR